MVLLINLCPRLPLMVVNCTFQRNMHFMTGGQDLLNWTMGKYIVQHVICKGSVRLFIGQLIWNFAFGRSRVSINVNDTDRDQMALVWHYIKKPFSSGTRSGQQLHHVFLYKINMWHFALCWNLIRSQIPFQFEAGEMWLLLSFEVDSVWLWLWLWSGKTYASNFNLLLLQVL